LIGYSFIPLGLPMGPGRGMVSFGLTGGDFEDPAFVIVCLAGNLRLDLLEDGRLVLSVAVAGGTRTGTELEGGCRIGTGVSGGVRTFAEATGPVRGRC